MINRAVIKTVALSILALALGLSVSVVGLTGASYNDTENSTGNLFSAASLDFSLDSEADFTPEVDPETDAARGVSISNDGSLGFQYTIKTTGVVGALCSSLNLVAELDSSEEYNGPLSGFDEGPFVFSSPEDWDFTVSLTDDDPDLANETCDFDFEYSGWQDNLVGPPPAGFSDIETISNTVTSGDWEVDSCMTEPGDTVSTVMTGSSFGTNGHNLIVASGGELKSPTSGGGNGIITVSTDCDVTVQGGGKITAAKGDGKGGTLTIGTRDFTVDVGGMVTASSTASGKDGGTASVTTTGDFTVNGTFSANGHDGGGSIVIDSNDDISVSGSSLTATGTNKDGGSIILSADDDITVAGLVSVSAKDQGGTVFILSGGDLSFPVGGSVLAESTNKKGGWIEAVVDGAGDISGTVSVDGKDGDGFIVMTIQENLTVGGTGLMSANSTGSGKDGGTIGIKVGGDATYDGIVRANATKNARTVALWSEGGTDIDGMVSATGGTTGGDDGGDVDITVRGTLSGAGVIDATGDDDGSILLRTVTNSFVGTATPAAVSESLTLNSIVLNEIIPDPAGSDTGDASLPLDGEWMELYNKSGVDVDVNAWVLMDADGNILTISASKGDNDNDLSDAGETIVPAGGTLTVYRNGAGGLTLNDDGDTVQLLTDLSVLVDSFTYVLDVGTDNSIARMPDGTGAWVDPEPTPTAPNGGINIEKLRAEFLERLRETAETEEVRVDDGGSSTDGGQASGVVANIAEIFAEPAPQTTIEDDTPSCVPVVQAETEVIDEAVPADETGNVTDSASDILLTDEQGLEELTENEPTLCEPVADIGVDNDAENQDNDVTDQTAVAEDVEAVIEEELAEKAITEAEEGVPSVPDEGETEPDGEAPVETPPEAEGETE